MLEGIKFVEFGDAESGSNFTVAFSDLSVKEFRNLERLIREAVEGMSEYDTFEELVRGIIINDMNMECEFVYPDHFITI